MERSPAVMGGKGLGGAEVVNVTAQVRQVMLDYISKRVAAVEDPAWLTVIK